jgi:hypothetical protein
MTQSHSGRMKDWGQIILLTITITISGHTRVADETQAKLSGGAIDAFDMMDKPLDILDSALRQSCDGHRLSRSTAGHTSCRLARVEPPGTFASCVTTTALVLIWTGTFFDQKTHCDGREDPKTLCQHHVTTSSRPRLCRSSVRVTGPSQLSFSFHGARVLPQAVDGSLW